MPSQSGRALARDLIRRTFYLAIGIVGALYRLRHPSGPVAVPSSVRRILIIRLDLLGDVLHSLTAAAAMRGAYPEAHITLLTLPYTAPLAHLSPDVDEVMAVDTNRIRSLHGLLDPRTWSGYWRAYRRLRDHRIDVCLSLCGPMASLWAAVSGARCTIGFAGEAYPFLLSHPVSGGRHDRRRHETDYIARLVSAAGVEEILPAVRLPVSGAARARITELLGAAGVGVEDRLVVIHAGSINGSAKRWPAASWARFADELHGRTGAKIVLTGAASDEPIAREVLSQAAFAQSLVGRTSVEELIALLERADLVASGDSGPLHLAASLGRPVVAVYGPTDPIIYGPTYAAGPVRLHRRDLPCSPCYTMAASAECPLGDPICMRLVSVRQMVESALELLPERERPRAAGQG